MERYHFTEEMQAALESLQQPFGIYQFIDKRVVTLVLSDGFCELFGYADRKTAYAEMNADMYKDAHPDDMARLANEALRFATEGGRYEAIYRMRVRDGSGYKVVHAFGKHKYTDEGVRLAHVWYADEGPYDQALGTTKSELNKAFANVLHEQSALKASSYDFLTGLPSMTYFFDLAEAGKEGLLAAGEQPVFLYFDLIGMKFYNRKYGFEEGDNLLRSFSRLMVRTFSNENCCHIGGDHFAAYTKETGVEDTLNRLFFEWHKTNRDKGLPVRVGIYSNGVEDVPASVACDRAKLACDTIRNNYTSMYGYYDKELRDNLVQRQYVLSNIDKAIEDGWIQVYYQPIVRAVNGMVCDEEALARWIDPKRGFRSPDQFIPYLEDAGEIYRVDIYVLERVLEKIKKFQSEGKRIVPQSINLSRSDFDSCDIVEEIRKRVDAAGISHDLITLEITESTIGENFDFIKEQIGRFQRMGFPVWMDDFGSGYSSMDVLQSVRFNLIKFDMSFMKRLDEGETGKIILTELMKMTTSLGLDTVCEGVETEDQVRFLRAIGCSKLQGYYYSRPLPLDGVVKRIKEGIKFENPEESSYFQAMGRINLYDLSFLANKDENVLRNTFDTLPMSVMEYNSEGDMAQFTRYNESFKTFAKRFFGIDLSDRGEAFPVPKSGVGSTFMKKVGDCRNNGDRVFIEEKAEDGCVVTSFARRIDTDPVTGKTAAAVAVLSISEPNDGATYAGIARALAADYYNLFYVDVRNGDYIEYSSAIGGDEMDMERRGTNFFESARTDAKERIYEKDQESFLGWFTKENIVRLMDQEGSFTYVYRLMDSGEPVYARMKIVRMVNDADHVIVGISIIDAEMKYRKEISRMRREKIALGRIAALSTNYIVLYTIDPENDHYIQFSPSHEFASFGLATEGQDFFGDVVLDAPKAIDPRDIERHLRVLTKENMMREIAENGYFVHNYRLLISGGAVPVSLKATLVHEDDGEKILLGVSMV